MALQVIPPYVPDAPMLVAAELVAVKHGPQAHLGHGLLTPFRRDEKNDFAHAEGAPLVRAGVSQVLGMRAQGPRSAGELRWDPKRGSLLHTLRHQKNAIAAQELARVYVVGALRAWEPRLRVTGVAIRKEKGPDGEENVLAVDLVYDLISTNTGGNQVQLAGVEQTVRLAR